MSVLKFVRRTGPARVTGVVDDARAGVPSRRDLERERRVGIERPVLALDADVEEAGVVPRVHGDRLVRRSRARGDGHEARRLSGREHPRIGGREGRPLVASCTGSAEYSVGEYSVGEYSVGENSVGEYSVGEYSVGDVNDALYSVGEYSVGRELRA